MTVHRLANGLRVVHANHPGRLASVQLWFDAGTADEADHERGAAHLLEHMLFKGTERFGIGEHAATIEAEGGDLNAYTTWDQTVLHATVNAEAWATAIDVITDMAWNSRLDADELARERPVVLEEIRGYAGDPESVVEDAVAATLFPDHPYGTPVLGTEASVSGLSRETLVAFWRRHYTAGRAILAVAGPMTEDEVLALARTLTPPPTQPYEPVAPPKRGSSKIFVVDGDFDTPVVTVAFHTPGDGHDDNAALEVLASALGSGRAAILPARLRFGDAPSVADIWTSSYSRRSAGSFEIGFVPRPGRTNDVLRVVLDVCADPDAYAASDLERGRANLLTDLLFSSEAVETLAHDLAWFTGRDGSPAARHAWREAIAAVTTADVRRVAHRYLVNPLVAALGDVLPTVSLQPCPPAPASARIVRATPADQALDGGRINSVYLAWPGGIQAEDASTTQHTDAWAALVTAGAGSLGTVAFASELDRVGASVRAVAGRSSVGLQLSAPATSMERAIDLLADMLQRPRFEPEAWDRIRDEALMELDLLDDRPDEVLARRVWALAWPGHPWGVARTRGHLRRTRVQQIHAYHERWITASPFVGIAGPCDNADGWVRRLLDGRPTTAPSFPAPVSGPQPTGHFESRAGSEQALIVAVTRLPSLHHPHTAALRVATAWMSAQSGPLFVQLREERSLAYSVWASMAEAPSQGLLTVGLATEPERHLEARRALLDTLARLADTGPSESTVKRTVAMLLGQLASADQSAASRAVRQALAGVYGVQHGSTAAREALEAVSAADVREALGSLVPPFTVTVRPR